MIDTHTHLFSHKFDGDRGAVIERALAAGVTQLYLPNIDVDTVAGMLALERAYPRHCHAMLGLHPTSVKRDFRDQLAGLEARLHDRRWAAIGEIGTDLYWSDGFWAEQQEAFLIQCNWAIELDRPVSVHCRSSVAETLELLRPLARRGLRGVLHCFSGSVAQALQATSLGFYLGIGGVLTYKKNEALPEVVRTVDRKWLVVETDSPYLAPVPMRGKRNESSFLPHVVARLAEELDESVEEVELLTTANAKVLFS